MLNQLAASGLVTRAGWLNVSVAASSAVVNLSVDAT